jgi:hypothetical protein
MNNRPNNFTAIKNNIHNFSENKNIIILYCLVILGIISTAQSVERSNINIMENSNAQSLVPSFDANKIQDFIEKFKSFHVPLEFPPEELEKFFTIKKAITQRIEEAKKIKSFLLSKNVDIELFQQFYYEIQYILMNLFYKQLDKTMGILYKCMIIYHSLPAVDPYEWAINMMDIKNLLQDIIHQNFYFMGESMNMDQDQEILKKKPDYVRVHDSGDYYSKEYLNKWIEIAIHNCVILQRTTIRFFYSR